eukprot:gene4618-14813_t
MSPILLIALSVVPLVTAVPMYFVDEWSQSCFDYPTKGYRGHKFPVPDTSASFMMVEMTGEIVSSVCPGKMYNLHLDFPKIPVTRVAYLLSSNAMDATFQNAYNKECPNRVAYYVGRSNDSPFTNMVTFDCTGPATLPETEMAEPPPVTNFMIYPETMMPAMTEPPTTDMVYPETNTPAMTEPPMTDSMIAPEMMTPPTYGTYGMYPPTYPAVYPPAVYPPAAMSTQPGANTASPLKMSVPKKKKKPSNK